MTLRTITLMAALLGTGLLTACEYCLYPRSPEAELLLKDDTVVTTSPVKLHVLGMSCPKCVSNVDIQLMRVPGVQKAQIDMGSGVVTVDFDPSKKITRAALAKAVDDSGLTIASIEGK